MRTLVLTICLLIVASSVELECGAGGVPDLRNVCIEPDYIEGCYRYATDDACHECAFSKEPFTQIINSLIMANAISIPTIRTSAAYNSMMAIIVSSVTKGFSSKAANVPKLP